MHTHVHGCNNYYVVLEYNKIGFIFVHKQSQELIMPFVPLRNAYKLLAKQIKSQKIDCFIRVYTYVAVFFFCEWVALACSTLFVTGFAKTRHNPARTEIHFIA